MKLFLANRYRWGTLVVVPSLALLLWWSAGLNGLDRFFYDSYLQVCNRLGPAPYSPEVVFLDIRASDRQHLNSYDEEYRFLAQQMARLRDQGALIQVLDVLIQDGKNSAIEPILAELSHGDSVVGRLRELGSLETLKLQPEKMGLVYTDSDPDGIQRRYTLLRQGHGSEGPVPSLALAAYLLRCGLKFDSKRYDLSSDTYLLEDFDDRGEARSRRLNNSFYPDYRFAWSQDSSGNFSHITPQALAAFEKSGARNQLEGKTVFIGYVDAGGSDIGANPIDSAYPKVLNHATAYNDLIQQSGRQLIPWIYLIWLPWLVQGWALFTAGRGVRWALAGWLGQTLLIFGAATLALHRFHLVVPSLSLVASFSLVLLAELYAQSSLRQEREIEMQATELDVSDPLLNKNFGPYKLVSKLGQGGFATVYRALPIDSLDPQAAVAIKIVPEASLQNEDMRRRFGREIRISTELDHPNIVKILQSGQQNNVLYLVMEFLRGQSLREFMERGPSAKKPWNWAQAREVLLPLLEGVVHAHTRHVLHRDLKPENIMVEYAQGKLTQLKIVDFGLAFDDHSSNITRASEVVGTLNYLAPERIQGVSDDPGSDQYSIGMIAYELLAGQCPFAAQSGPQAIMTRLTTDCPPLASVAFGLPATITEMVDKMLARDPKDRFASCTQVLEVIRGY